MQAPKIFIVDDSQAYLVLLEKVLNLNGYETSLFHDARDVLNAMDEEHPELILSDIQMPEVDGFQLMELVRERFPKMDIPFVYISSTSSKEQADRALELSSNPMLAKPVSRDDLLNMVNEIMTASKVA